jgi:hypothetical protein
MATTYIGYWRPAADSPVNEVRRTTGANPPELDKKRREFPASLPPTCKILDSWFVLGSAPSALVVEAESIADIGHISTYYAGWLEFDWHACMAMPRD